MLHISEFHLISFQHRQMIDSLPFSKTHLSLHNMKQKTIIGGQDGCTDKAKYAIERASPLPRSSLPPFNP